MRFSDKEKKGIKHLSNCLRENSCWYGNHNCRFTHLMMMDVLLLLAE